MQEPRFVEIPEPGDLLAQYNNGVYYDFVVVQEVNALNERGTYVCMVFVLHNRKADQQIYHNRLYPSWRLIQRVAE